MTVSVDLDIRRSFRVAASATQAFGVLADVPYSVSHFPDVERLIDEGDGVYTWILEAKSTAGISHQVVYACRYTSDLGKKSVEWEPVMEVGNGVVAGAWSIADDGQGCCIDFRTTARLELDVPRLLSVIAVPFVRQTFERQIDRYIENLQRTLNAGVT